MMERKVQQAAELDAVTDYHAKRLEQKLPDNCIFVLLLARTDVGGYLSVATNMDDESAKWSLHHGTEVLDVGLRKVAEETN